MRTVISFNEGCSGNFLAAFLTQSKIVDSYRIDSHPNLTHLNYSIIAKLNEEFKHPIYPVIVTHESDSQLIRELLNPDLIIRIEPITGLFTAIYNVFNKKLIIEDQSNIQTMWPYNPSYCYDQTFEHMKDYYTRFSTSQLTADETLFDFGWLYNRSKIVSFLEQINMTGDFELLEKYQQSQLPLVLDLPATCRMEEIVSLIPKEYFMQTPWFACYCLFCFELNNNLTEGQRKWSINHLSVLGPQDLIELSTQY